MRKEAAIEAHNAKNAARLQAARDEAARAAELASGATPAQMAVNDLGRRQASNTAAESAAANAAAEAVRVAGEKWAEVVRLTADGTIQEVAKARTDYETARQAQVIAEADLAALIEENRIRMEAAARAAVETQNAEFVNNLNEAVSQIEAGTEGTAAAKAEVLRATQDGRLTADELRAMGSNMSTLIGGLQTGMATTNGNLSQLLQAMFAWQAGLDSHSAAISQLQRQQAAVLDRINSLQTR